MEEKNIIMGEIFEKFADIFGGHFNTPSKEEQVIAILKNIKKKLKKNINLEI